MVLKVYALFTLLFFSSVQCNQLEEPECPQNPISSIRYPYLDRQIRGYGMSELAGGAGNGFTVRRFDDEIPNMKVVRITKLKFWAPNFIWGMETTYELQNGTIITRFNGNEIGGEPPIVIDIQEGETIVEIKIKADFFWVYRFNITIQLSNGDTVTHEVGYFDWPYLEVTVWKGPILGFYGINASGISGIGVYYARIPVQGPKFGGFGGREWTDPILTHTPQITNIDKIIIHHGVSIDSIQVYYLTMWGDVVRGDSHGGTGGTPETIDLQPGEMITQMDTTSSESLLSSVMFTSRKSDGTEVQYGPYGTSSNNKGTASGKIIGFYGTEGHVLDSLGVYTMDC